MSRSTLIAASLLLAACAPEDDSVTPAAFETEGWIDTSPPGPPGPRPGQSADEDGEFGDEEDEEDEEGDEDAGAYWGVFAVADGGTVEEASGEFFAFEGGEEVCLILFEATASDPPTACSECSQAWTFTVGSPEAEIDVDGACERRAPANLEGTQFHLGYAGDTLYRDDGSGWRAGGEFNVKGNELWMEWSDGGADDEE